MDGPSERLQGSSAKSSEARQHYLSVTCHIDRLLVCPFWYKYPQNVACLLRPPSRSLIAYTMKVLFTFILLSAANYAYAAYLVRRIFRHCVPYAF